MGVKGLGKYVSDHASPEYAKLERLPVQRGRSFIAVDGYAVYRKFGLGLDWLRGGDYGPVWYRAKDFVDVFSNAGVQVDVVYDGNPQHEVKLAEWKKRRLQDRKGWLQAVADLVQGHLPDDFGHKSWQPANFLSMTLQLAFTALGAKVLKSLGEGDAELARLAQSEDCLGVLSNDSDFFVFRGIKRYFSADHCEWKGSRLSRLAYFREGLAAELLGLHIDDLPLLATLAGNDFSASLPARPKSMGASLEQIAGAVRALRPATSSGASALAEQIWPAASDGGELAKSLQRCLDQYSVAETEPLDALGDAHLHGRIPANILPARLQRCVFTGLGFCAPGMPQPRAVLRCCFDPEIFAFVFADLPDVDDLPECHCSLHSDEPFEENRLAKAEGRWPTLQQVWEMSEEEKRSFFERLCRLPSSASVCCSWGNLGCALLAGMVAMKVGMFDLATLRLCLLAMVLVVDGATLDTAEYPVPTAASVHNCWFWMQALAAVESRWRLVFDGGRLGQTRQHFFQPAQCFHGPLTCFVLDVSQAKDSPDELLRSHFPKHLGACSAALAACTRFLDALTAGGGLPADKAVPEELLEAVSRFNDVDPYRSVPGFGKGQKGKGKGKSKGKGKVKGQSRSSP